MSRPINIKEVISTLSLYTIPHPHPNPPLEGVGIIRLRPLQGGGWEGDGVSKMTPYDNMTK
jgi:hypothetical protein